MLKHLVGTSHVFLIYTSLTSWSNNLSSKISSAFFSSLLDKVDGFFIKDLSLVKLDGNFFTLSDILEDLFITDILFEVINGFFVSDNLLDTKDEFLGSVLPPYVALWVCGWVCGSVDGKIYMF